MRLLRPRRDQPAGSCQALPPTGVVAEDSRGSWTHGYGRGGVGAVLFGQGGTRPHQAG